MPEALEFRHVRFELHLQLGYLYRFVDLLLSRPNCDSLALPFGNLLADSANAPADQLLDRLDFMECEH